MSRYLSELVFARSKESEDEDVREKYERPPHLTLTCSQQTWLGPEEFSLFSSNQSQPLSQCHLSPAEAHV